MVTGLFVDASLASIDTMARARGMAALLGLLLVALGFFLLMRLMSYFTRRRLRQNRRRSRFGPDHWAARRLLKRPAASQPRGKPPVD